ncbi:dolichyl-phosphate-mannose--protein mannosyltransferase [Actinotalea fermentans]|uniref:Polyprenol-phosphate-mannose--protein mannosyltransferase n=1 Tax=Actinotalea fermentans TaxID=43671 RepID=A0A511YX83_9CELL|nr:glycosyltransferase family 39 protein [Actinotalea fermentans]GEN79746.1 dolichyl-phosphate-mannose--protein mannosyltransferase [Actinotalea fermentans]
MTTEAPPAAVGARLTAALERGAGWPLTLAVTALAAAVRLPALDRPYPLVFDETYYVKDGWTLATLGYEAQWPPEPNPAFEAGLYDSHLDTAAFVVHPPVGKWLIGLGMRLLGGDDRVGWRIAVALAGILTVLLVVRAGRRLLGSTLLGGVAGTLVALDGTAIVESRVALLDGILAMFLIAAFAALLVDRDHAAAHLTRLAAGPPGAPPGTEIMDGTQAGSGFGPRLGLRPWRLLAGVLLGLALGTKWSALYFVAAFGLLSVGWDAAARRRAGVRRWWQGTLLRDALPAFASLVGVAAAVYVATWTSWFASAGSYGRQWAASQPGGNAVTDAIGSWWHFHAQIWNFHTTLEAEHPYSASPLGWIVQWRPTSFFYESPEPAGTLCGAERCAQAVTSLGNPFVWWLAAIALVAAIVLVVRRRDLTPVPLLVGVAAGWLPWFAYADRPIFAFYAVAFLPFLALLLAWAATALWRWSRDDDGLRRFVVLGYVVAAVLVVGAAVFFYPVWTGQVITFEQWQLRQWLQSWV